MEAAIILKDFVQYLQIMGNAKNIIIVKYEDDKGLLILKDRLDKRVAVKLNKGSNSIDVAITVKPYKNSDVEVLQPYRKQVRDGLSVLLNIVEEAFDTLNKENTD